MHTVLFDDPHSFSMFSLERWRMDREAVQVMLGWINMRAIANSLAALMLSLSLCACASGPRVVRLSAFSGVCINFASEWRLRSAERGPDYDLATIDVGRRSVQAYVGHHPRFSHREKRKRNEVAGAFAFLGKERSDGRKRSCSVGKGATAADTCP